MLLALSKEKKLWYGPFCLLKSTLDLANYKFWKILLQFCTRILLLHVCGKYCHILLIIHQLLRSASTARIIFEFWLLDRY
jgi:hypothetical protein